MTFFQAAKGSPAYVKVGIYGEAGSGKTTTTSLWAIGLHKHIKSTKPIVFMDTESGSDFLGGLYAKNGVGLEVAKVRSIDALLKVIPEAIRVSDILIIDSISHPYQDMLESYLKKTNKKRLAFQDWNTLKPMFRQFTDAYTVAPLHIFIAGRSQGIWDYFKDEDTGKMELYQVSTKMKVEKEMGYEPSLLVEMERVYSANKKGWIHRATIMKDRNPEPEITLDGKQFDDPTFQDIFPHVQCLGIGGEHQPVDISDSQALFDAETGDTEWKQRETRRQIAMEEFSNFMGKNFPNSTGSDKLAKLHLCEMLFGTTSGKAIEGMSLDQYKVALAKAKLILDDSANIEILTTKGADLSQIKVDQMAEDTMKVE